MTIRQADIQFIESMEGMEYDISGNETHYEVTVVGLKADLDKLTVQMLEPTIDVSSFVNQGTYQAVVSFKELDGIKYNNEIKMNVVVTEAEPTTEDSSDNGTSESTTTTEKESSPTTEAITD